MSRSIRSAIILLSVVALAGCAARAKSGNDEDRKVGADATVIGEEALRTAGSNVLNILPTYVAGLRVTHTDGCPEILMRGTRSLMNSNDPVVYVDGTRAGNTCVLETLVPTEVQRIEVYPMGVTTRPGYRNNPNGLILVFMKTTQDA